MEYDYFEQSKEFEALNFSAKGVVQTADSEEVNFSVELAMERSFVETTEIHIRAGDAMFGELKVWFKDSVGNNYFESLSSMGIGAILLENENTQFSLKGEKNNLLGQLTHTGIFLRENGSAGTLQEIDLAV